MEENDEKDKNVYAGSHQRRLALTPVTANAAEAAPSQVTETVIATPLRHPKSHRKKAG